MKNTRLHRGAPNCTVKDSERWSTVWYVCGEYERSDEPDQQCSMAIWEEMKEYGVDQSTISDSSLLSKSKEPRRNGGTHPGL